jgi:hypothetical protein
MSRIRNLVRVLFTAGMSLSLLLGAGWLAWYLLDPLLTGSLRIKSYSGIISLVAGTGLVLYVGSEIWKFLVPGSKKKRSPEIKSGSGKQPDQK